MAFRQMTRLCNPLETLILRSDLGAMLRHRWMSVSVVCNKLKGSGGVMIAFFSKVSLTWRDHVEWRAGVNGRPGGFSHGI